MSTSRLLLFAVLLLFASTGLAMGFFDRFTVCLFSATQGTVTLNGEPVANATVTRLAQLGAGDDPKTFSDSTTTDESGRFAFDALTTRSMSARFTSQPVIRQTLTIAHDGKDYPGWQMSKLDFDEDTEIRLRDGSYRPMDLVCELSGEPTTKKLFIGGVTGLCTFDGAEEIS